MLRKDILEKLKVLDLFSGYKIYSNGVVLNRHGREIKQQISKNGYVRVELWESGKGKKYLLHRLLAESFIPNTENKPQINHIDGNKLNNSLSNLEWTTQSENQKHAYKLGLQKGYRVSGKKISDKHKKALCGSRWKKERHLITVNNEKFNNLKEAANRFNVSRQTVLNRFNSDKWPRWVKEVIWLTS